MKLVIAGSRNLKNMEDLETAIEKYILPHYDIDLIIHGGAIGIDQLAGKYAAIHNIPCSGIKPKYLSNFDRGAPLRRNQEMAEQGDLLLAVWDGESRGTKHMIECMNKLNKPVFVHLVKFD